MIVFTICSRIRTVLPIRWRLALFFGGYLYKPSEVTVSSLLKVCPLVDRLKGGEWMTVLDFIAIIGYTVMVFESGYRFGRKYRK